MKSIYFEKLLSNLAENPDYNHEMPQAKEEFERFAGPIYESDRYYDSRINSFHNWYLLDRPLKSRGVTPLISYLEQNETQLDEADRKGFQELEHNLHSVFELLRSQGGRTRVRDLLTGKKFDVDGQGETEFMDKNTLFNSRIFTHEGKFFFSNYFLLHPGGVYKLIVSKAKKVRKAKTDTKGFLFQLVLFQSRWDQYKQMELHNIYRFES